MKIFILFAFLTSCLQFNENVEIKKELGISNTPPTFTTSASTLDTRGYLNFDLKSLRNREESIKKIVLFSKKNSVKLTLTPLDIQNHDQIKVRRFKDSYFLKIFGENSKNIYQLKISGENLSL
tara:strand:- start:1478 stop:1846 length:369 start_codon:yes stop_codon:yes gene_type:complete